MHAFNFSYILLYVVFLINFCVFSQENENGEKPSLYLNEMSDGEIQNVAFHEGPILTDHLYAIGFAPHLRDTLLTYITENGVLDQFQELMSRRPFKEGESNNVKMKDGLWHIQRPEDHWNSNMHWISPAEEKTQLEFLKALGDGGFDTSLEALGNALGMDGLFCFHLTFIAVTQCSEGYIHRDFEDTDEKGFNLIIPILLKEDSDPELDVWVDATEETVGLKYQYNTGILLGDEAYHATSAIDYTGTDKMRVMATIYLADINENNVENILKEYTQEYPPADTERLLASAGGHWPKPHHLPRSIAPEGGKPSIVFEKGSVQNDDENFNSEL